MNADPPNTTTHHGATNLDTNARCNRNSYTDPAAAAVFVFPLPFRGHTNPMLQLARALHSKAGFSITVVHVASPYLDALDPSTCPPDFSFVPIPIDLAPSEASMSDIPRLISLVKARCVAPFEAWMRRQLTTATAEEEEGEEKKKKKKKKKKMACLVWDSLLSFAGGVVESMKVRSLALRTSGATSLRVYHAFPSLRQLGYLPIQDSRSEEEVLGFEPLQVKDLPVRYSGNVETVFELLGDIIRGFKNSSGVILNTFEDLERPDLAYLRESLPIPIFAIGPFHKFGSSRSLPSSSSPMNNSQSVVEDKGCISWLDKQLPKSVIYVSFGSVAAVSETEFSEIALGLADSQQPFLWVIRSDSVKNHDSGWLEKLPRCFLEALEKRGKIVKWAPQIEVLGHRSVGAFWTHNGWNSTIESVSEGVPMLCMPCFADQTVNARYVSDVWRVGVHLNGRLERANIARAIKRLLVEREGEELRERTSQLKEKADLGWKLGGSSHQSFDRLVNHILSAEL